MVDFMSFAWDAIRWEDVGSFRAYLFTLPRPSWVRRIVIHHTWKPVQADWRGLLSMAALERYYRDEVVWYDSKGVQHQGWPGGPHLFVCKGSPNPLSWDGIYQGTPVNQVGVHAGVCNDGIGVEVVGNFDGAPWGSDLRALNIGVVGTLLDWTGLSAADVLGHRDCGSPKTCPGTKVDLEEFKLDLVNHRADPWSSFGDCPPPEDQRGWDFNQRWLERRVELGPSKGCPEYIEDGRGTVIRVFQGGLVVDDDSSKGRAWTWKELLKP